MYPTTSHVSDFFKKKGIGSRKPSAPPAENADASPSGAIPLSAATGGIPLSRGGSTSKTRTETSQGVHAERLDQTALFKGVALDMHRSQYGEEMLIEGASSACDLAADEIGPLAHLYRAEVGRLTVYRVRMDTTTNWAVTTMGALVTFALGSNVIPQYFFFFILMLQLIFCVLEARRYMYYCLVRHRCRLMERGMFAHILAPELPAATWRERLRLSYTNDAELMNLSTCMLMRMQRTYIYIFLATFLGWTFKLIVLMPTTGGFPFEYYMPITGVFLIFAILVLFVFKTSRLDV